jgi:hypothetical protein
MQLCLPWFGEQLGRGGGLHLPIVMALQDLAETCLNCLEGDTFFLG